MKKIVENALKTLMLLSVLKSVGLMVNAHAQAMMNVQKKKLNVMIV